MLTGTGSQFTGCDESQAKVSIRDLEYSSLATRLTVSPYQALIAAKSEVLGPRDPRSTGVFDSLNLDRHEGFITGISLRALDRTQPHERKLLTLLVSIPHLGLAANSYKAPAKPDEVSASRKTLQEYRFMRSKASQRTTDLDGIVCVHQTWFLLFDDGSPPGFAINLSNTDKNRNYRGLSLGRRRTGNPRTTVSIPRTTRSRAGAGEYAFQQYHNHRENCIETTSEEGV